MTWMYTALAIGIGSTILSVVLLIAYMVAEDDRDIGMLHGFVSFLLLGFMTIYLTVANGSHNENHTDDVCKGRMVINKFMTDDQKPLVELDNGHLIEVSNSVFNTIQINDAMTDKYCENFSVPYAKKTN